jgi:hypothetical protein
MIASLIMMVAAAAGVAVAQDLPAYCTNTAFIPPVVEGAVLRQVHVGVPVPM